MTDHPENLRSAQETLDVAQEASAEAVRARDAAIQSAYADGLPVPVIVDAIGVHRQIIYRIIRRRT